MKLDYNKIVSQVTDKLDLSDEKDLKEYKKKKEDKIGGKKVYKVKLTIENRTITKLDLLLDIE